MYGCTAPTLTPLLAFDPALILRPDITHAKTKQTKKKQHLHMKNQLECSVKLSTLNQPSLASAAHGL